MHQLANQTAIKLSMILTRRNLLLETLLKCQSTGKIEMRKTKKFTLKSVLITQVYYASVYQAFLFMYYAVLD